MFTYFTEFYKQALYHFVVSVVCSALFGLGLEYSKASERDTNIPYFMPAMVLSGMHFILTVVSILAFYYASSLSEIYDGLKRWDSRSEKNFRRLKVLYLLLLWPCFIWSIVGASLVGQTGICSNKEKPCYYSVKKWQNRTVAIVTIVIHVLNGILTLWILTSRHKIRRDATCENGAVLQKHAKDIHPTTLNLKPPYFNAKNEKKQKDEEDSNKIKLSAIKDPQSLQKHKNIFEPNSISGQFHQTYENKQDFLPPIKKPLKRYHTVHDGQIGLASGTNFNYDAKDPKTSKIKPLSSKKKTNRLLRTGKRVTKLRIVAPQHRSASFNHSGALYSDSDGSSGNVDRRLHANDTNGFLIRRMSEHPRAPPPSYNEIIEQSDTDPYWLPPLPENNPKTHNLPENIYSGYSYPDTAPVPVYPEKVPKAQWQIGDA